MAFISIWIIQDIVREYRQGEVLSHLTFELMVAVISIGWIYYLVKDNFRKNAHIVLLTQESQMWKEQNAKLIHGLSHSIHDQLNAWGLTSAEKEVALLLLKGLSFREIAEIRSTSEKTTRQQAMMIYQKSKLPGRAELSAFFFEDLLTMEKA